MIGERLVEMDPQKIDLERHHFIDVLKGICIIFIIVTHYAWTDKERLQYLFPFWIDMAVPIFMIISGFVYAISYEKHAIVSFGNAYSLGNIINKIIRYTVPFTMALVIEEIVLGKSFEKGVSLVQFVRLFLVGGIGSGSYYYPIMIQFVFVFPVIYFIIKRHDFNGLIICGFTNFMYELLKRAYGMNVECYRLLVFRYILIIAFGCYLAVGRYKIRGKVYALLTMLGAAFIMAYCYAGYTPLIVIYWTGTSFLACLYIMPIAFFLIKMVSFRCRMLEVLGKASFNIFLVQMIFYNKAYLLYSLIHNRAIQLLVNILVCIIVGVIFYYIEIPITRFISKKIYNSKLLR